MLREFVDEFAEPDRVDLSRSTAGLGQTQQRGLLKKLFKHGSPFSVP
jgi:hypothetical protein